MKAGMFGIMRWVCAALAVISLIIMFGGNTVSSAEATDVAAAVTAEIDMTNMLPGDNKMIKRFYGLDPAQFESCILYYPTTNMMAEELLIVKLREVSQQETVRQAVEARITTQKNTFEGYGVEQFALLSDHAVVEVRGNYVFFVVNAQSAAARDAFLKAL